MDSFGLKIIEGMLYSNNELTIEQLSTIASSMYSVRKSWSTYYWYNLLGTGGRHKRIGKVFKIKLPNDFKFTPEIYTYLALLKSYKGKFDRSWSSTSPYSKPPTWDVDNG